MYDYGSSVNLPNQQVVRVTDGDLSMKQANAPSTSNPAMMRKQLQDVKSSIECLPGVCYKPA